MSTVNGFQVGSETLKYNYESLENYNTPNFSTSSSKTYYVGDYVMYNGKLYKCTTATTGGTWNGENWTEAILSDDVADVKNAISEGNLNQHIKVNPFVIGNNTTIGTAVRNRANLEVQEDGSLKLTSATGGTSTTYGCYFRIETDDSVDLTGHKLYIKLSGLDFSGVDHFSGLGISGALNGQTSGMAWRIAISGTTITEFENIYTLTGNMNQFNILLLASTTDNVGEYFSIGYALLIDLTVMFGAGNEPDIDTFTQYYNGVINFRIPDFLCDTKQINTRIEADAKEMMSTSHGGICNEWNLTSTAKATLYNDGLLYVYGNGTVSFTEQNPAPWLSGGYETQIHRIVISDNVNLSGLNLVFATAKFDGNSNVIYGKTSYADRLDIYDKYNAYIPSMYGQFDYRHVNYAKCLQAPTANDARLLVPNAYKRAVCSVPQAICSETLINNVKARIRSAFSGYDNTGSCLFITDSVDFHNAVYEAIELQHDAKTQAACILCDNLGSDGFPDYWTEPMKRVFPEIMPYIGRQLTYYKDSNAEKDGVFYPYRGPMSSLGNYAGYGWPTPFSANAQLTVYINHVGTNYFEKYADFPGNSLSYYLGQPMSPALDELATGVSCSGLINLIYWRYFGENFALSASAEFNRLTGKIGNHLPLVEIQESELAPFDIINMAIDVDHDDDIDELDHGGHCAIYLGSYTIDGVTKHNVLQCNMGSGIVFGEWAFDDAWFESRNQINTTKYLRLQKGGISANVLSQPTT